MNAKIEKANELIDSGDYSAEEALEKLGLFYTDTGEVDEWPIVEIDGDTYRMIDSPDAICGFDQLHKI